MARKPQGEARLTQIVNRPSHRYYVEVSAETATKLRRVWEMRGDRDITIQHLLASIVADWASANAVEE